ncbi:hypothetical protein IE81DRAFT_18009 [Ceraceosorus guamensis]|uniref:Uncharacterized protein n=1 Tax=Ceraceosorus guamensis TaxID=1522189 RepID=A0A316W3U5_9BASI|nr:hypothetical protein IE81DRAFT_18009 [Ceraceosorus guamensis]PWN44372.1 hypothetical protein IE81DRAFT_18009 [Ceraceosorus guamensis]
MAATETGQPLTRTLRASRVQPALERSGQRLVLAQSVAAQRLLAALCPKVSTIQKRSAVTPRVTELLICASGIMERPQLPLLRRTRGPDKNLTVPCRTDGVNLHSRLLDPTDSVVLRTTVITFCPLLLNSKPWRGLVMPGDCQWATLILRPLQAFRLRHPRLRMALPVLTTDTSIRQKCKSSEPGRQPLLLLDLLTSTRVRTLRTSRRATADTAAAVEADQPQRPPTTAATASFRMQQQQMPTRRPVVRPAPLDRTTRGSRTDP